uniref:Thioredoxin domain-containing protein n=1 Tax=Anopheles culicifacies TaxID=139723 RepID=A0A182MF50_9DIPT
MGLPRIRSLVAPLCFLLLASSWLVSDVDCAKKAGGSAPAAAPEATIEEVSAKQLERLLEDKDYVAVYWYARSCTTCDTVLAELEHIDDDTDSFGVDFVKINDKRLAKQYGITKFPALTYFREKEPIIYEGDLMDEAGVLDFLTSLEAMDLPDRIEEVNAKILSKIIEDSDYVAVLFCKCSAIFFVCHSVAKRYLQSKSALYAYRSPVRTHTCYAPISSSSWRCIVFVLYICLFSF